MTTTSTTTSPDPTFITLDAYGDSLVEAADLVNEDPTADALVREIVGKTIRVSGFRYCDDDHGNEWTETVDYSGIVASARWDDQIALGYLPGYRNADGEYVAGRRQITQDVRITLADGTDLYPFLLDDTLTVEVSA